jgi:hypothetical protein
LEFQALPLQEMCYIQTARLISVHRISSSGFYHNQCAMFSSHHKTQHPNIQTLTNNCHTFKPMSECSDVVTCLIVSHLNMVVVFWISIQTAFHNFLNQAPYTKYWANLTSNRVLSALLWRLNVSWKT